MRPPGAATEGLRIGLLGGSFNPAHEGHVHASMLALKRLQLDHVWWLVSPKNPLKGAAGMAPLKDRLAAARRRAGHPRLIVTGIEAALGTSYTVDTLAELKRRFPRLSFVWIMGTDNLLQLPRWRRWQQIFSLVPVAVVARPGTALAARTSAVARRFAARLRPADARLMHAPLPAWTVLEARHNPQSATQLRARRR